MKTIYKIKCITNKKVYIGQTKNYNKRYNEHSQALKYNRHINPYLQHDYNAYGINAFEYSIIEVVEDEYAYEREDY